jgi:Ca2+-binding RTX toxin-like protein
MPMLTRLCGLLVAVLFLFPATALAQGEDCDPRDKRCIAENGGQTGEEQGEEVDRCGTSKQGEQCGEGNGRKTPGLGNTGNVSHKGWPPVTGILWKVLDSGDHERTGTADNDELLGHHGDDTLIGLAGRDILWGDWEKNNPSKQSDVLRGGDNNDFLYPSHGKNNMYGGDGSDRIIAYYGHGLIDCGPGKNDLARTRWQHHDYRIRNCERALYFCAFGSKPNGDCKKPGESNLAVLSRQADQRSLLSRLDAW